jgi:lysophospholipase L1-like esterase
MEVKRREPDIIFLHLGENDIGNHAVGLHHIVEHLIRLIETLVRQCRPRVMVVGQLTRNPAHWRHGTAARDITDQLRQYVASRHHRLGNTKLKVWTHQIKINGVNGGRYFDRDDVHLNAAGMEKYYRSVTAAIGRYARIVIEERKFDH